MTALSAAVPRLLSIPIARPGDRNPAFRSTPPHPSAAPYRNKTGNPHAFLPPKHSFPEATTPAPLRPATPSALHPDSPPAATLPPPQHSPPQSSRNPPCSNTLDASAYPCIPPHTLAQTPAQSPTQNPAQAPAPLRRYPIRTPSHLVRSYSPHYDTNRVFIILFIKYYIVYLEVNT